MNRLSRQTLGNASDVDLASLAVAGDREAFGELVRRAAPTINSLLRRMGAQAALADDLTQDAMIAALKGLSGYRGPGPFKNWAMTIAARLYLKRFRKEARTILFAEVHIGDEDGHSELRDDLIDLDRALARLSPSERLCVTLCHGIGMTHEEISASLQVPLGTVKSHVLRGVKRLRALMVREAGEK